MRILKLLVAALLLLSTTLTSASGIDKMFVHRSAGEESLYFIFSQKLPADKNTKAKVKSIDYDYTYLQKTDSIAMLVTLSLPNIVIGTVVDISAENDVYSTVPELIYADPKGRKIIYRYRILFPFNWFERMYSSFSPFSVSFHNKYDGKEEVLNFEYDDKKWLTNRVKMCSIIDMIKLNSGK